jgi:hypothetical protein
MKSYTDGEIKFCRIVGNVNLGDVFMLTIKQQLL